MSSIFSPCISCGVVETSAPVKIVRASPGFNSRRESPFFLFFLLSLLYSRVSDDLFALRDQWEVSRWFYSGVNIL